MSFHGGRHQDGEGISDLQLGIRQADRQDEVGVRLAELEAGGGARAEGFEVGHGIRPVALSLKRRSISFPVGTRCTCLAGTTRWIVATSTMRLF
jgi:hypothetical protein